MIKDVSSLFTFIQFYLCLFMKKNFMGSDKFIQYENDFNCSVKQIHDQLCREP